MRGRSLREQRYGTGVVTPYPLPLTPYPLPITPYPLLPTAGVCTKGFNSYSCACTTGYTGVDCESEKDWCHDPNSSPNNPCLNGAFCTSSLLEGYTCTCLAGFTGTECETNIDDCASNPCQNCDNSACCTNQVNGFTCDCESHAPGYTEFDCSLDIDECASFPCQNDGVCTDVVGNTGFSCACPEGFEGATCQTNKDDCDQNGSTSCLNGGTCTDLVNNFKCACPAGFAGDDCGVVVNFCGLNPCLNGGACSSASGGNGYQCGCTGGASGDNCETPATTPGCDSQTSTPPTLVSASVDSSFTYVLLQLSAPSNFGGVRDCQGSTGVG